VWKMLWLLGIHWFLLIRISKNELECFDSLGVNLERQSQLKAQQFTGIRQIYFNKNQLQPSDSSSCGQFCLFFIFERLHNLDFSFGELINEILTEEKKTNEKIVTEFYNSYQYGFIIN
jgi:hypothetical protein